MLEDYYKLTRMLLIIEESFYRSSIFNMDPDAEDTAFETNVSVADEGMIKLYDAV